MKINGRIALILATAMFAAFLFGFIVGSRTDRFISLDTNSEHTEMNTMDADPESDIYIDGLLNLNAATMTDLLLLPGIGETLAKNILQYREMNGPFQTVDDLLNVPGIGTGRLNSLKELVTVAGG